VILHVEEEARFRGNWVSWRKGCRGLKLTLELVEGRKENFS
jgi:hypothetical protein